MRLHAAVKMLALALPICIVLAPIQIGIGQQTSNRPASTAISSTLDPGTTHEGESISGDTGFDPVEANHRAESLVAQMTNHEKIQFLSSAPGFAMGGTVAPNNGAGFIQGIPRLGIPSVAMVDSSTGSGTTGHDQFSTNFPAPIAIAASWDRNLSYQYGAEIALQLRAQGFAMGLGGGVNLGRDPREGRMFEYLGEDPELAGELIAQRIAGTLSEHVIPTIKHFVANEQETGRTGGVSSLDERTLRELYALPFEIAIKETPPADRPGSVMCAYNKVAIYGVNSNYSCESPQLLNGIIKSEWGFDGEIQSDWGAVKNATRAFDAGLDELETGAGTTLDLSRVPQSRIDDAVRRRLYAMIQAGILDDPPRRDQIIDYEAARKFAQYAEEQSIVLLRNVHVHHGKAPILPLRPSMLQKGILVVGSNADEGVPAGGGSGDVRVNATGTLARTCVDASGTPLPLNPPSECYWWDNPWVPTPVSLVDALQSHLPGDIPIAYVSNSDRERPYSIYTRREMAKAVALAKSASAVIFVLSKPAREQADLVSLDGANFGESFQKDGSIKPWGYCGTRMADCVQNGLKAPPASYADQVTMLKAVAAANPNTIVDIESGNPVLMPWLKSTAAVLEAWYPGEAGGAAIGNVLFGTVNPSGHLPITFPAHDSDIPTWGKNGKFDLNPTYTEKLFIGYRWYEEKKIKPLFAFGFGLSYTTFAYSNLKVRRDSDRQLWVSFTIKNTGEMAGADVPQVYLAIPYPEEPPKRLVGWQKVFLQSGDKQRILVHVTPRMQSIWDVSTLVHAWKYIPKSTVYVGESSSDIKLHQ